MSDQTSQRVAIWVRCDGCGADVDTFAPEFSTVRNVLDSTMPRRGHRQCIDCSARDLALPSDESPKLHRRDPYVAIAILAGHLRDGHDDYHSGAWEDCQENECAETRGIVGDAP